MQTPEAAAPGAAEELKEDLAAFLPAAKPLRTRVRDGKKLREIVLQVLDFNDVPYHDTLRLLELEEKIATATELQPVMAALRAQTELLCPDAPAEDLDRLSRSQMLEIGRFAAGLPPRPRAASGARPTSEPDASGSASSSPVPLASSAGATSS